MTTSTPTINDILFASGSSARRELGERLVAARMLSTELVSSAHVGEALASLFDMPVGDVLFGAWHGNHVVQAARARTRARPGTKEKLHLLDTDVTSIYHPQLDLDTGARRITLLTMELEVELKIEALILEVAGGNVVAVGPGLADTLARLRIGRTMLAERRVARVRIGRAVGLMGMPEPSAEQTTDAPDTRSESRRHEHGRRHRRRRTKISR
jgi:hypothetical protein